MAGIGNTIGVYVKSSEATKLRKYTSYAHICVYLNISKPLPGSISLEYQDEDWSQTIDYEHISFRYRKCHEHRHLFRDCPLNVVSKGEKPETSKAKDGFIPAVGRRRQVARKTSATATREPPSSNPFDDLHQIPENMDAPQAPPTVDALHGYMKGKTMETPVLEQIPPISTSSTKDDEPLDLEEGDIKMDLDEQDLTGIDLEHLEQAYRHQQLYTIPPDQLRKVHKVFLNSSAGSTARSNTGLGI